MNLSEYKPLTGGGLKLMAMTAMLIDHLGALVFPGALWMRVIGRLAFPIFAFQIARGYRHTRNFRKYWLRILAGALATELIYDHTLYHTLFYPGNQNILFTLLLGLWSIRLYEGKYPALAAVAVLAGGIIRADYGALGVLTVLVFHVFREQPGATVLSIAAIHGIGFGGIQSWAIGALVPIFACNGRRGSRILKPVGYLFYPLHLLILDLIA